MNEIKDENIDEKKEEIKDYDDIENNQNINFSEDEDEKYELKLIQLIENWLNINYSYINTLFNVIFGSSLIVLIIVLFSDINPKIIPFKIIPIEFNVISKLTGQISIFCTFLSFITDNVLFMRFVLCISFGIGIVSISLAPLPLNFIYIMWYFIILLINLKHIIIISYNKRHIIFDEQQELIYNKIFKKLMSRSNYQLLLNKSLVRCIKQDRFYINVGDSCDNLTILISGKMKKTDKKGKISYVQECTFIDSPEFIMQKNIIGQQFNISFYAETECNVLMWPRETINILLDKNKEINSLLLGALGIDVSKKVFVLDILK